MLVLLVITAGHAHIGLEAALGKSLWLIAWCTSPPPSSHASSPTGDPASSASARIMAYTTIMDNILSKASPTGHCIRYCVLQVTVLAVLGIESYNVHCPIQLKLCLQLCTGNGLLLKQRLLP